MGLDLDLEGIVIIPRDKEGATLSSFWRPFRDLFEQVMILQTNDELNILVFYNLNILLHHYLRCCAICKLRRYFGFIYLGLPHLPVRRSGAEPAATTLPGSPD